MTAPALFATRWQWRELVASQHGPPAYTTRLVLLVLSLPMQGDDKDKTKGLGVSWPSQMTIAERTGLRLRTVKLAIAVARRAGWLSVAATVQTNNGRGWRGNEYTATVPAYLAEHIPDFDLQFNRPVGGAYDAPRREKPPDDVVHMTVNAGAYDRIDVVHQMPPESLRESLRESSSERARGNGGASHAPPSRAQSQTPDDLKNRVSDQSKATEALRQIASAALARPIGPGSKRKVQPITDSELVEKVRKLRGAGHDDALIKKQLSGQAAEPQLKRVLERA